MIGLFDALASWQSFVVVLAIFGFFPRMALRLIVLAFHREDPRRGELMAELHAVPRVERPLWVAEQLELAISEGLWGRFEWMLTGRVIHRWHLSDGVERNRLYPDTFSIPSEEDKDEIRPGDLVKAEFAMSDWAERMWVEVTAVRRRHIVGRLSNTPAGIPRLQPGRKVKLRRKHVIDFVPQEDEHSCPEVFGCSAELSPPAQSSTGSARSSVTHPAHRPVGRVVSVAPGDAPKSVGRAHRRRCRTACGPAGRGQG